MTARTPIRGITAAIVDLDGTMVDTLGDFAAALNLMLAELALPAIAPQRIETMVGKGSEHLVHSVLAAVGAPRENGQALFDKAFDSYQRHYASVNGRHSEVYPGVVEGLQWLAARGMALA